MDNEQIRKVLAGDPNAFRYFIKTYQDMAYTLALSILRDEHRAKEAVHEAFVKAYKALPGFKQSSKFSSWLYRIVVNEAFLRLRKHKQEKIEFVAEYDSEPVAEDALLHLELKERKMLINEALSRLPVDESLALRLFYLEEASIREVESITGWSQSKVKVSLHRGRKRLWGILQAFINKNSYHGHAGKK